MMTSSDQVGDMDLEDVLILEDEAEFRGLEPDNEQPIDLLGKFQKREFRSFDEDFGFKLDQILAKDEINDVEDDRLPEGLDEDGNPYYIDEG